MAAHAGKMAAQEPWCRGNHYYHAQGLCTPEGIAAWVATIRHGGQTDS